MSKKIGILTYYYKTHNYGGMLQSYALTYFLNENGFDAEQICYTRKDERPFEPIKQGLIRKQLIVVRIKNRAYFEIYKKSIKPKFNRRNDEFFKFEKLIPHSDIVYNLQTISDTNLLYNYFITGSDQIWTFRCFNPSFFLEFVSNDNKKISYAASVGKSEFSELEKKYLNDNLNRFDAISVREKDLVNSLSSLQIEKNIQYVVDPTLLLNEDDWNKVASKRLIEGKYIFCYFLGDDDRIRKIAKKYAKNHKMKLVTIPFANETFNVTDFHFGDFRLYNASPEDFVSLIKNANCIFTDSYHATVFSLIYKKEFFAFNRIQFKSMSSRLYSLTNMFECSEHFCDTNDKFCFEYIKSLAPINYGKKFELFESLKNESVSFLINNLKD